jgi:hypothetical protein
MSRYITDIFKFDKLKDPDEDRILFWDDSEKRAGFLPVSGVVTQAFKTITGITNDVVADSASDTLTLASGNSILGIVGTASTDTITFTVNESVIDHDQLTNFTSNEHFLQTAITNVSTALSTGLLKVTTGTGALSVITDNSSNWNTAYSWGDHAGLYDTSGTASGLISTHESTYNHSNYNDAYAHISSSGASHTYINQDVTSTASPSFVAVSLGTGELTCGSINRASGTLTLEIGDTAEISITSTDSTFGGNIIIPDGGTIGSVSDTDVMTISSAGVTTFSVFPVTPSAAPTTDYQVANKKYVDDSGGGGGGMNYVDRGDPSAYDFGTTDLTTDEAYHDLDLSGILPEGAYAVYLKISMNTAAGPSSVYLRKNGNSEVKANRVIQTQGVSVPYYEHVIVPVDENRIIEYWASNVTWAPLIIHVLGWFISA